MYSNLVTQLLKRLPDDNEMAEAVSDSEARDAVDEDDDDDHDTDDVDNSDSDDKDGDSCPLFTLAKANWLEIAYSK